MSQKIYARVRNQKIEEYPVYAVHIKNRSHPVEWYTECFFKQKPELPDEFHYHKEIVNLEPTIDPNKFMVVISYEVLSYDLTTLLRKIHNNDLTGTVNVRKSEISEEMYQRVLELSDDYIESKLNAFAKTRKYKSIESLCSYKDDADPVFSVEAARGIELRRLTWLAGITYVNSIKDDLLPIPKSLKEIDDQFPALTWE